MRIHVVGASGSGKTTLARQLAHHLHCRHIELDAYYWRPTWQRTPTGRFQSQVHTLAQGERWVLDGTYECVRELVWDRADTIVWLDYAAPLVVYSLLQRGVKDIANQTDLWGTGNRECWSYLIGRESIVAQSLQTQRRLRESLPALREESRYRHLNFVHLRTRRQALQWLNAVCAQAAPYLAPGYSESQTPSTVAQPARWPVFSPISLR